MKLLSKKLLPSYSSTLSYATSLRREALLVDEYGKCVYCDQYI